MAACARIRSWPLNTCAFIRGWVAAASLGCGNDPSDGSPSRSSDGDRPLFDITGSFFTPETNAFTGWLSLVPELRPDLRVEPEETISFGPDSFEVPGDGTVLRMGGDAPEMERLRVQDDSTLVSEGIMSFASFGVGNASSHALYFLTDTKAYFLDRFEGQVIVWNPQSFEIVSSFRLDGFARDGLNLNIIPLEVVDDRLILLARYTRVSDSSWARSTVVGFVNTRTDEVVYDEDDRCGNAVSSAISADGTVYLGSFANAATATFLGQGGMPPVVPCQLRIMPDANEIDPSYFLDLTDATGADLVSGPVAGAGDAAYYLIYDPEVIPIPPEVSSNELQNAEAWRVYSATLGREAETLAEVPDFPPGGTLFFSQRFEPIAGEPIPLFVRFAGDFSETTMTDIRDPDNFTTFLVTPGVFGRVRQVR